MNAGTIKFSCPHCGKEFAVNPDAAGKKGKCKGCGGSVRIPRASEGRAPEPPPIPPPIIDPEPQVVQQPVIPAEVPRAQPIGMPSVQPVMVAPMGAPTYIQSAPPTVQVNIVQQKSPLVAFLLAFLFGPLGMLYSTVPGALIMLAVDLVFGLPTLGLVLIVTWPIQCIWATMAASKP